MSVGRICCTILYMTIVRYHWDSCYLYGCTDTAPYRTVHTLVILYECIDTDTDTDTGVDTVLLLIIVQHRDVLQYSIPCYAMLCCTVLFCSCVYTAVFTSVVSPSHPISSALHCSAVHSSHRATIENWASAWKRVDNITVTHYSTIRSFTR